MSAENKSGHNPVGAGLTIGMGLDWRLAQHRETLEPVWR